MNFLHAILHLNFILQWKQCSKQILQGKQCLNQIKKKNLNIFVKKYPETAITQECCEQYWTSPGGNTQQSTDYTATYLPSGKLSKLDEPDMQDTAGEAGTSS